MKKLLTLLLALSMTATLCAVPAMAASDDLKDIYKNYELGSSVSIDFDELTEFPSDSFTAQQADSKAIESGAIKLKNEADSSNTRIDLRPNASIMEPSTSDYCLFSFKVKIECKKTSTVSLSLGASNTSGRHDLKVTVNESEVKMSNGSGESTAESSFSQDEWTQFNILTDSSKNKYYFWLGEYGYDSVLSKGTLGDAFAFTGTSYSVGFMKCLRLWVNTSTECTVWFDDYSRTLLTARSTPLSDAAVALACVNSETILGANNFKTAEELGIDANVEYVVENEDYINNGNVVFPLFEGTSDVTVNVTGEGVSETKTFSDVVFPSGYTTIGSATATGNTVSIPVTLRNSASAREDELLVIAAVYDTTTKALIASKSCTLNEAKDKFVAEFDTDVSAYEVKGFVWQNGTLRPVQ